MGFKKLNKNDKQQLFEFIAALAITAGQEMSEEGYRMFNDIVLSYINKMDLMDDFIAASKKSGIGKHPHLVKSGHC